MIGIEKLFDNGEDVLCSNPNITFLHSIIEDLFISERVEIQKMCQQQILILLLTQV
jgi:hypothetical protein